MSQATQATQPTFARQDSETLAEKDSAILSLQSKVQQLTEDKDILAKELEEDRHWVNNQHTLMQEILELTASKQQLEEMRKRHEEELHNFKCYHGKGKCRQVERKETPGPERMITTNASISKFFSGCQ